MNGMHDPRVPSQKIETPRPGSIARATIRNNKPINPAQAARRAARASGRPSRRGSR